MAAMYNGDCRRLIDVLDVLGTGLHCNSFSTRGKIQTKEVDLFKQTIGQDEHREPLERFCKELFLAINSCIAEPAPSTDDRREKSYQMFYAKRIGSLKKLWNDFHGINSYMCSYVFIHLLLVFLLRLGRGYHQSFSPLYSISSALW